MNAYPDAKVILTNRDPDAWFVSCERTLLQARTYWAHSVLQYFDWVTGLVHALRKKTWKCLFDDDFYLNGKASMEDHYHTIRLHAKQQKREVLELHIGNEWAPLCDYLGVSVPDIPYPRENQAGGWIVKMHERASMRASIAGYKFLQYFVPLATVSVFGILILRSRGQRGLSTFVNIA